MLKAIKQGMKKLIPGQSGARHHAAQSSIHANQTRGGIAKNKTAKSSLPESYLDTDALFK
jgi:hypothetical protein